MVLLEEKKMKIENIFLIFDIISIWRGMWGLMDIYLFSENSLYSFWASIIIGVLVLLLFKKNFNSLI